MKLVGVIVTDTPLGAVILDVYVSVLLPTEVAFRITLRDVFRLAMVMEGPLRSEGLAPVVVLHVPPVTLFTLEGVVHGREHKKLT